MNSALENELRAEIARLTGQVSEADAQFDLNVRKLRETIHGLEEKHAKAEARVRRLEFVVADLGNSGERNGDVKAGIIARETLKDSEFGTAFDYSIYMRDARLKLEQAEAEIKKLRKSVIEMGKAHATTREALAWMMRSFVVAQPTVPNLAGDQLAAYENAQKVLPLSVQDGATLWEELNAERYPQLFHPFRARAEQAEAVADVLRVAVENAKEWFEKIAQLASASGPRPSEAVRQINAYACGAGSVASDALERAFPAGRPQSIVREKADLKERADKAEAALAAMTKKYEAAFDAGRDTTARLAARRSAAKEAEEVLLKVCSWTPGEDSASPFFEEWKETVTMVRDALAKLRGTGPSAP